MGQRPIPPAKRRQVKRRRPLAVAAASWQEIYRTPTGVLSPVSRRHPPSRTTGAPRLGSAAGV